MFHIGNTLLVRPSLTLLASHLAKVCALRKDQQPHWIFRVAQLFQMPSETWFVRFPFSREKDEVVKLRAPSEDWDVLERLLQDDVYSTVHFVRVCYPPKVKPISVELVGFSNGIVIKVYRTIPDGLPS